MSEDPQPQADPVKGRRWPLYAVLGALAAVAVTFGLIRSLVSDDATSPGGGTSSVDQAVSECKDHVLSQLKSPASAQFGNPVVDHRPGSTADFYTVTGTVDSQNSFGAMLRNTFTCELSNERNGTWTIYKSNLSGR